MPSSFPTTTVNSSGPSKNPSLFESQLLNDRTRRTLPQEANSQRQAMPHSNHHKHPDKKAPEATSFHDEVTPESIKKTPLISGEKQLAQGDTQDLASPSRSSLHLKKDDHAPLKDDENGSTDETRPTDPEYPMQNQISTPQNKR